MFKFYVSLVAPKEIVQHADNQQLFINYFNYLDSLVGNEEPDYDKIAGIFANELSERDLENRDLGIFDTIDEPAEELENETEEEGVDETLQIFLNSFKFFDSLGDDKKSKYNAFFDTLASKLTNEELEDEDEDLGILSNYLDGENIQISSDGQNVTVQSGVDEPDEDLGDQGDEEQVEKVEEVEEVEKVEKVEKVEEVEEVEEVKEEKEEKIEKKEIDTMIPGEDLLYAVIDGRFLIGKHLGSGGNGFVRSCKRIRCIFCSYPQISHT